MFNCLLCGKRTAKWNDYLCFICALSFDKGNSKNILGAKSLYPYKKEMRNFLLQAKVKGSKRSLAYLTEAFLKNPFSQRLAFSADIIVPAPSSLFSRIRGSLDVAWFLARALGEKTGTKLETAPFNFYFSRKKRAKEKRKGESFNLQPFLERQDNKKTLLIIDDVLTTGFTLYGLSSYFKKDYNLKYLTLAYARENHKSL